MILLPRDAGIRGRESCDNDSETNFQELQDNLFFNKAARLLVEKIQLIANP